MTMIKFETIWENYPSYDPCRDKKTGKTRNLSKLSIENYKKALISPPYTRGILTMTDLPYISAPVGRNGKNRPINVAMVQSLLNEYFRTKELSPSTFSRSSPSFPSIIPNQLLLKENYSFKVDGLISLGPVCSLCEAIG